MIENERNPDSVKPEKGKIRQEEVKGHDKFFWE